MTSSETDHAASSAAAVTVRARAHSDDGAVVASFDAGTWFAEAADDEILALAAIGWGGDYAADDVATGTFARDPGAGDGALARLFAYLEAGPTMGRKNDQVGFECRVDEEDALAWIARYRPALAEAVRSAPPTP